MQSIEEWGKYMRDNQSPNSPDVENALRSLIARQASETIAARGAAERKAEEYILDERSHLQVERDRAWGRRGRRLDAISGLFLYLASFIIGGTALFALWVAASWAIEQLLKVPTMAPFTRWYIGWGKLGPIENLPVLFPVGLLVLGLVVWLLMSLLRTHD